MKIFRAIIAILLLLAFVAHAEDGYRLWLRYDKIQDEKILEQYSQISGIVVAGNSPTLAVIREELQKGLSGLLGRKIPTASDSTRAGVLVVSVSTNSPWQSELDSLGGE